MNHSDDDSASLPDPLLVEPATPETSDALAAPAASAAPIADPAPVASKPSRSRWRKWLLYVFATLGALALVLVVVIAIAIAHDKKTTAPKLSRDDVIDESMTRNYGKYSESAQGWLYVDPATKTPYVMQVLQRAQVDVPSDTMTGVTAVYFLVSGTSTESANKNSLLGMFRIQPDTAAHDGTLTETAMPVSHVVSDTPVTAQDVRFEALSKDTWGWVVKTRRYPSQGSPDGVIVDDVVYAPHDGNIAQLASFPASSVFTAEQGCDAAQVKRDKMLAGDSTAPDGAAQAASSAASSASGAADAASEPAAAASGAEEEGDEGEGEGEGEEVPMGCSNASWTYSTGDVPADGFVTISVKGGGKVNGTELPVKTYKLVFDPKSFTYVMPADMPSF